MRLAYGFKLFQKLSNYYSKFRQDYTGTKPFQVFKTFGKVFCFHFKFPYSYNSSTQRFYTNGGKDLLYSFYFAELVVIISTTLILLELINLAYAENVAILPVVLLLISFILLAFDFIIAVAISFAKQEHVAFCNDFIRQVEQLGKCESNNAMVCSIGLQFG